MTPDAEWVMFTIYDQSAAMPGLAMVRATVIRGQADPEHPEPLPMTWLFQSIDRARAAIREAKPSAMMIPRDPHDDPAIVESWF